MKKIVKVALVTTLLASILTGCSKGGPGEGSSDSIKVGLNFELTGNVAEYGISEANGAELAIKLANDENKFEGKQVVGIKLDNKSETSETVSVVTKLATVEKVVGMVGPAVSGLTMAGYPIAEKYKVSMISPSATSDGATQDSNGNVFNFAFRTCFLDSYQGTAMAYFAVNNLQKTKAVIIGDSTSDYAKGLADSFANTFVELGGSVVAKESYVEKDTDFSTILTKIADLDFDVIYIPGYYNEVGLIIKQARELGINVPIVGGDGFDSPTLIDLAGAKALNDVYFTTAYTTVNPDADMVEFVEAYKAAYGVEPTMFSALSYDAVNLLLDAVKRADSTDPVKVQEALVNTESFKGVTGSFSFDELHNPIKSVLVVSLVDGVQATSIEVQPE